MEDVVAIKATDSRGKRHFFLTWGRAFGRTDSKPLLDAIRPSLSQFGLSRIRRLEICPTLQDASDQPYFFEALLFFTRQPAVSNVVRRRRIGSGKDIYYLGKPVT
jgi:hypothetical protein